MHLTVVDFLDGKSEKKGMYVIWFFLALIYGTILLLVIEEVYPIFYQGHNQAFRVIEFVILVFFTAEYILRILFSKNRLRYIFSFYGFIDLVSILPSLLGILGVFNANGQWLRYFKILRLARLLKLVKLKATVGGILGKLIPIIAIVIGFKALLFIMEQHSWWPVLKDLNIIVSVIGFTLAILLGTKLKVVNDRLYAIEDSVCRIVGAMRDMENTGGIKSELIAWSKSLEDTLKSSKQYKHEKVKIMRGKTSDLEIKLEEANIGGPNTANFHRDVTYLLHRITAESPEAYEKFLKYVLYCYIFIIAFAVPGLTGLVGSFLVVLTLGGMYFLVEDMDSPLNYEEDSSYIDARLDALEIYNHSNK